MQLALILAMSFLVEVASLRIPSHIRAGHQGYNITTCVDDDEYGWNELKYPSFTHRGQHMGNSFKSMCTNTESGFKIDGNNGTVGPDIVFWHLEKAGGHTVLNLLGNYTTSAIHIVKEYSHFTPDLWDENYFRIGVIREPCSYYNSLYHWGKYPWESQHGWTARHLDQKGLGKRFYGGGHDKDKFHDWLRYMNDIQNGTVRGIWGCGLLSMRFWTQLINPEALSRLNAFYAERTHSGSCTGMERSCPVPLGDFIADSPEEFLKNCSAEIAKFDFSKFDCWIRLDHMHEDFGSCLNKYMKRGGIVLDAIETPIKDNVNRHPSCEDMYDPDSSMWVNNADGELKRRFGFTGQCCTAHQGDSMPFYDKK